MGEVKVKGIKVEGEGHLDLDFFGLKRRLNPCSGFKPKPKQVLSPRAFGLNPRGRK